MTTPQTAQHLDRNALLVGKLCKLDDHSSALACINITPTYTEASDGCILARLTHTPGLTPVSSPVLVNGKTASGIKTGKTATVTLSTDCPSVLSVNVTPGSGPSAGITSSVGLSVQSIPYPTTDQVFPNSQVAASESVDPALLLKLCRLAVDSGMPAITISIHSGGPCEGVCVDGYNPTTQQELTALIMPRKAERKGDRR